MRAWCIGIGTDCVVAFACWTELIAVWFWITVLVDLVCVIWLLFVVFFGRLWELLPQGEEGNSKGEWQKVWV